ncbi:MAG: PLP-dependent aspartate aminotransferase family protein [Clostridiales bacterium]|jgi:cystathionine beta-lyase/cystathionine gamma-synthase|nr:PLP-dependent aspartate aminotransferase family protein [Clostridiales bacterium]
MKFDTLCVHGGRKTYDNTGSIVTPIFQTATFARGSVGGGTGYDYSRLQNPTREQLELRIAALDGGCDALAFSSGMAAISVLMEMFETGGHLIISDDLYGGTLRFFNNVSEKKGLSFSELSETEDLEKLIRINTKAVFIETPTNPMMKTFDLKKISEITRRRGLMLIVDNTFLTPYFQRPIDLGADAVVYSGTKYLAGHNDTLAGFLVVNNAELSEKLRFLYKTTGSCLSPLDSWLVLRGLKTLHLRMERQNNSAQRIAEFLYRHPNVEKALYPGIGGMISFYVKDEALARASLEKLNLIYFAESLGGVETLITYPMTQTHADIPCADRERKGINGKLLRISVGIEDPDDIISDLNEALKG